MEEKGRAEELLDRIEKLIVDGNKEVLQRVAQVETALRQEIHGVEHSLRQELGGKIDRLEKKTDTNADAAYDLLKDVREDVKKVADKIDEHMRQPAHAR